MPNAAPLAVVALALCAATPPNVVVSVDAHGSIFVDGVKAPLSTLAPMVLDHAHGDRGTLVYVRAEPATAYGDLVAAMDAVMAAGFRNVAVLDLRTETGRPVPPKPPASPLIP